MIPGAVEEESRDGNIVRLPFKSGFYHPDLVQASDVVVGKLGYSTVAETYHAGARLFFVARPQFRESAILEKFARDVMAAEEIPEGDFVSGDCLEALAGGIPHQIPTDQRPNGANHAAELILDLLPRS